ncbi:winged helix-turn-helix transcriptional regulator [Qingshengfaniella alkalisoli]
MRYDEGCLAAHALNVIGDRWALLVVRELMFAPKRFQMIRAGLPGISASVLTGRLSQLGQGGVVDHDDRLGIYTLTDLGRQLMPVLDELCRWGLVLPGHDPSRFISPSALMISMRVNIVEGLAADDEALAGFDFDSEAFEMRLEGGRLRTTAVARPDAPFVLSGSGNNMARAVYGHTPLSDLIAQEIVRVRGDLEQAQNFVGFFRLGTGR